MNSLISFANVSTIFRREFRNYYNTPIGYIFGVIFLVFTGLLFFFWPINFWEQNTVDMTEYFNMCIFMFCIFVPSVSMRLWAEEARTGTIETLLTLPMSDLEIVLGKFLGATAFLGTVLALSLTIPLTLLTVGSPDIPLILAGYIVTLLVGAAYVSLGLFMSSLFSDQIIAFVVSLLSCILFTFSGWTPVTAALGDYLGSIAAYISLYGHFDNMASGFLDFRDIIYFVSFIAILVFLNVVRLSNLRRGSAFSDTVRFGTISLTITGIFLFNIAVSEFPIRYDLTGQYNISDKTEEIVEQLPDTIYLDTFLTKDVKPQLMRQFSATRTFIKELAGINSDRIKLTFYDPEDGEKVKKLAGDYKVQGQMTNLNIGLGGGIEQVYQTMVIRYGDKTINVPNLSQNPQAAEQTLYKTVREILNPDGIGIAYATNGGSLAADETPAITNPQGGEATISALANSAAQYVKIIESEFGKVRRINLEEEVLDESVKVLIIAGPEAFDHKVLYKIDQYLMGGGNVIFYAQTMDVQLQNAMPARGTKREKVNKIVKFFAHYGIRVNADMVKDDGHRTPSVLSDRQGGFHYPFLNVATDEDFMAEGILRGSEMIISAFPSSLRKAGKKDNLKITFLARSSKEAELDASPYGITLGVQQLKQMESGQLPPQMMMQQKQGKQKGQFNFVAMIEPQADGKFESFYAGDKIPKTVDKAAHVAESKAAGAGKILVVSSAMGISDYMNFIDPQRLDRRSQPTVIVDPQTRQLRWFPGAIVRRNATFAANTIKHMMGEKEDAAVETDAADLAPIRKLDKSEPLLLSLVNLLLMPLLLGGVGLYRFVSLKGAQREYEASLGKTGDQNK